MTKQFTSKKITMLVVSLCLLFGVGTFLHVTHTSDLAWNTVSQATSGTIKREDLDNGNSSTEVDGDFEFRLYVNNVRYSGARKRQVGEEPWSVRKAGVVQAIKSRTSQYPTLIGLQECLHNQLTDVLHGLNKDSDGKWVHYGIGRDDGHKAGEYSPIIYNTKEWKLLNGTTRWLSETPDTPSIYPGAATKRIVTITTFQHLSSGKYVNYLNTHYDQKSADARRFSSNEILTYIREIPNDYFTFLSGDFNSVSTDVSYTTLQTELVDTDKVAYNLYNENLFTYSGFAPDAHQNNIDFIWAPKESNTDGFKNRVISHEVLDNLYDGHRFSDHRPITAHFKYWN